MTIALSEWQDNMKWRLLLSLACGILLNFVCFELSNFVMRFLPYKDKPGMPNTFTWLLIPGLVVAGQLSDHHWLTLLMAFTINTILYALCVFGLLTVARVLSTKSG